MRRLNLRPNSFISAFVGVDHFSKSFSLSLCLSLSLGDMITTAPHQSPAAVICPTFNVNTRGCHGEAGRAVHSCPLSFLSSSLSATSNVAQHSAFHHSARQSYTTLTYYLCQSDTPDTTFPSSSGPRNVQLSKLLLVLSCPLLWEESLFLLM